MSHPFRIERRGIDLVPLAERHTRPRSLIWLWVGTTATVFTFAYGALLVAIGLSFPQALFAIVLGNLIGFTLTGLTSLQGPVVGTSTQTISRAAFGPNGGRLLAFFSWLTLVGFEAGGLILIVFAALALLGQLGVPDNAFVSTVVILVAAAIQLVLPLFGYGLIMRAQRYFSYLAIAMFTVMAIVVVPQVDLGAAAEPAPVPLVTAAIALVIAAGGLSWAVMGSDYSRYLSPRASPRATFLCSAAGGCAAYTLLMTLGAAVASITVDASDPISGLPDVLPAWFVVPYLLLAIVTLLAVNTSDLYSSGLNLQTMGVRIRRSITVIVDLVICVAIAFWAVFAESFYELLENFLAILVIWLAPWAAFYLVDWLLRRGRYHAESLFPSETGSTGIYWRSGGVHVPAIVALLLGMAAATAWINSVLVVGPLSAATGGSDLSVFAGMLVGGGVYWLLARKRVRTEAEAVAEPQVREAQR
ncbi:MAG: thiamine permease [Streptosporangiales bacterium]|nr:thiamine permease [Streptosporangiales bacterium]